MRLRLGIWSALAVVVFGALLAAIPAVLEAAHVHWPAWPIALAGALVTALVGLAKPVTDTVTQGWANRTKRNLDRRDRARDLEHAIGGRDKGLPRAGDITDRALLGIHPSIPLPSGADPSLSAELPLYIPRDIDADLRAWITAHQESGGFLLLVGPAASGKTRCAYELVHDVLADWPMFTPSIAAQLTDYLEANPALGRLVIWLDETQKFLGPSGLTTATVRRILALPRPAIIIGTIWPQHYDAFTNQPGIPSSDTQQDSREILTMIAHRKDLLPGFSGAELDRAHSLARRDPRIDQAMSETASANLPEILAAAPDLISRWLNAADPYGAAVISAAVIAHRCGHPEPLPTAVLETLAETVLTPAQRGRATSGWFPAALEWARCPVRGPVAPLTPQATTPGAIEGDQVSDVLVQHASRHKDAPGHNISEPTWQLLIELATPLACQTIADVAYQQRHDHRAPITECAIRKAADDGNVTAMSNLGALLDEQGKKDQAEQWYRRAADAGNAGAMFNFGLSLFKHGKRDQAEQWYRKAADAGHASAMFNLGNLRRELGEEDEAEQWYRRAAETGHTRAMSNLGALLDEQGKDHEAERWYRRAAETGFPTAMFNLGLLLDRQGKTDQAEHWYIQAARTGHVGAMSSLAVFLAEQGKDDEAERWYRRAAETGFPTAMFNLGLLLDKQGKTDQADQWYRQAAAAGDTAAMINLGVLLAEQGKDDMAEHWFRQAADTGRGVAKFNLQVLGVLAFEEGKDEQSAQWHRKSPPSDRPDE